MMKRLGTTIGLLIIGCCAPAIALDLQGTGIKLNNWGLTEQSDHRPSLYIGERDWWNQAWRTHSGLDLRALQDTEQQGGWPAHMNLTRSFPTTSQVATISAGIGVQPINFSSSQSHEGLRLSLGGKIGIGNGVTFYSESAWVPGLLESSGFNRASGLHFETGVTLNPLPYLSIRAAYRRLHLDYSLTGNVDEYSGSQGIMIGTGLHW